ncbi:hypothetical protein [Undibacterium sp. Ji22W]|uniref:hypothetical protein n=1 Tax=Undibacterium sp. Ji22W TaxID=3413038 RepID=UPI003BF44D35
MSRSIYFILVGAGILVMFLNQNYDTRAFAKRGKQSEAQVAGDTYTEVTVRKGGRTGPVSRQYVEVNLQFMTESGELIVVKKELTEEMLTSLLRKKSIPITYLSNKPTKTRLSNESNDDGMGGILFGSAILLFGLIWRWIVSAWENRTPTPRKQVRKQRTRS